MKRIPLIIILAWLLYLISYFLPVEASLRRFPQTLPGWEALCVAFEPLSHLGIFKESVRDCLLSSLSVLSGLTNLLAISSPLILKFTALKRQRYFAFLLFGAAMINFFWMVVARPLLGYFVWFSSFFILGIGFLKLKDKQEEEGQYGG